MKRKKILLQCQGIIYYYMGLAAIYTKYPDRNVDVDVLFSSAKASLDYTFFKDALAKSVYTENNVYTIHFKKPKMYERIISKEKNIKNVIQFHYKLKKQLKEEIKNKLKEPYICNEKYSEIYFSHEQSTLLITSLKFIHPHAKFVVYGDGPGLLFGFNTKLMNKNNQPIDFKFFKEIRPDEVIGLLPYTLDESLDIRKIPIRGTDKETLLDLFRNDTELQKEINEFSDKVMKNYPEKHKTILLLSLLNSFLSEDDEMNIYMEIIDKYCSPNSLLILKNHPAGETIASKIEQLCKAKNIETLIIPENLKVFPIELYYNLLSNTDNIITFLSSSKLSINYLYNIDCIDAREIVQKYPPLADLMGKYIVFYRTINERTKNWNKKSLIYKCNSQ